jgi:cytoskeleton-associated protein 5
MKNSLLLGCRMVREVMSGVIAKCIAASKARTREMAVQITLLYIEIEKHEAVQEEVLKGMEHKNPKIVAACASAIAQALRYGYIVTGLSESCTLKVPCFMVICQLLILNQY